MPGRVCLARHSSAYRAYVGECRDPADAGRRHKGAAEFLIHDTRTRHLGPARAVLLPPAAAAHSVPAMSEMRRALWSQPDELRRLLADPEPADAAAERLRGRGVVLVGIGTSWHAAHHGAWLLREAGVDARAEHAADLAPYGRTVGPAVGGIVLSHTGTTGYSMQVLERARESGGSV